MTMINDNIGYIEVLQNKDFINRLNYDLLSAKECYISLLYLTPQIRVIFEEYLSLQKKLVIVTNHPAKFQAVSTNPFQLREELKNLGAEVHFYRAPWLCHEKILLLKPGLVYLGSHNFSKKALFSNHETTVRFFSSSIHRKLKEQIIQKISLPVVSKSHPSPVN